MELAREAAAYGWTGMSAATIGRRLVEIRGSQRSGKHGWTPPAARRPVAPVAPVVAQPAADADRLAALLLEQAEAADSLDVDAERARLLSALCSADTWEDAAALELRLACLDPAVAERLRFEAGETRPYALTTAGEHPLILSRPRDLADLALAVREDDPEAAAELLAEAHELVKETRP
ncbi:MAG TPA: hypothetical protein PLR99_05245 [Polyangiaceae bacterium]|nr:hypothetical protein [Polyangiaceae bacterium]